MKEKSFSIKGEVEIFPQKGGWHFVRAPKEITDLLKDLGDRGLIAITATVGEFSWDTSLLPMGDGTHFIALNAKVRKDNAIVIGDNVEVSFKVR